MAEEPTIAKSLDLSGLLCPIPVVKVSKAIKDIAIGEAIEATATDPGVLMDIPAWCTFPWHGHAHQLDYFYGI